MALSVRELKGTARALVVVSTCAATATAFAGDSVPQGLPPAIAKNRPSSSVPADLPGSQAAGCEALNAVTVYQRTGRGTGIGVRPMDLMSPEYRAGCAAQTMDPPGELPALSPEPPPASDEE
ncbi:MAG: hypothetical protein IPK66_00400 [Rhodospirillales bacterium]|nr:hypothetical protein [Rhodospirillales bacterium]